MEEKIVKCAVNDLSAPLPGSLALAFLGDTVYDLYVRARLVAEGGRVKALNASASKIVCAHAQSQAMQRIDLRLTEKEAQVARRARNARQNPPKNADPAEYHRATSLEAVLGYLALTGQIDRLDELMREILTSESVEGE